MSSKIRILVVDDDPRQAENICLGLSHWGYECVSSVHGIEAFKKLNDKENAAFDILVTDMTMPVKSGLGLTMAARCILPDLPIIVITGLKHAPELDKIHQMDIAVLKKPFEPSDLLNIIRNFYNLNPNRKKVG